MKVTYTLKHAASRVLHAYADWRVGATKDEKHCYKSSPSVLLTFDDHGTADEVHDILRILRSKDVKAAFFLQGDWAGEQPALVKDIAAAGHVLGNHTNTHAVLLPLSDEQIRAELDGGITPPWFRPPQGRYDARVRNVLAAAGYVICYWTIDSRDWTGASVAQMRHTILAELDHGAVILFHLHGLHTRELLPDLIDDIRARGFQLTSHDETWSPPAEIAHPAAS